MTSRVDALAKLVDTQADQQPHTFAPTIDTKSRAIAYATQPNASFLQKQSTWAARVRERADRTAQIRDAAERRAVGRRQVPMPDGTKAILAAKPHRELPIQDDLARRDAELRERKQRRALKLHYEEVPAYPAITEPARALERDGDITERLFQYAHVYAERREKLRQRHELQALEEEEAEAERARRDADKAAHAAVHAAASADASRLAERDDDEAEAAAAAAAAARTGRSSWFRTPRTLPVELDMEQRRRAAAERRQREAARLHAEQCPFAPLVSTRSREIEAAARGHNQEDLDAADEASRRRLFGMRWRIRDASSALPGDSSSDSGTDKCSEAREATSADTLNPTFTPAVNSHSALIDDQRRGKRGAERAETLYRQAVRARERAKTREEARAHREVEGCTFHPRLSRQADGGPRRGLEVAKRSELWAERRAARLERERQQVKEREEAECSFQPNTNWRGGAADGRAHTASPSGGAAAVADGPPPEPPGVDEYVDRLQYARDLKAAAEERARVAGGKWTGRPTVIREFRLGRRDEAVSSLRPPVPRAWLEEQLDCIGCEAPPGYASFVQVLDSM